MPLTGHQWSITVQLSMYLRLSILHLSLAPVFVFLAGGFVCHAQSARRQAGRPIEYADPRGFNVSTNLNQVNPAEIPLNSLEKDEFNLPDPIVQQRASEGVSAEAFIPLPNRANATVIPTKRLQEMLDRKRNWMFMIPDDLNPAGSLESNLEKESPLDVEYGPDGQEKKRGPSIEKFIAQQERQQNRAAKSDANTPEATSPEDTLRKPGAGHDFDTSEGLNLRSEAGVGDFSTGTSLNEKGGQLRSTLQDPSQRSLFFSSEQQASEDIFGLRGSASPLPSAAGSSQKTRMDEFRRLLDLPTTSGGMAGVGPASGVPEAIGTPSSALLPRSQSLATPGNLDSPALGPSRSASPGLANLPGLPGSSYDAMRVNPSLVNSRFPGVERRVMSPASPTFTAPRRAF
jgi:hypothetical protein